MADWGLGVIVVIVVVVERIYLGSTIQFTFSTYISR